MLTLIFKTLTCTLEQRFDDMTKLTATEKLWKQTYPEGVSEIKKVV